MKSVKQISASAESILRKDINGITCGLVKAAMESGRYTMVGNWWDRKGENEIDMIALNEFNHSGIAAEIKRNPRKLSLTELERKVSNLPSSDFGCYNLTLQTLSIEDLKK